MLDLHEAQFSPYMMGMAELDDKSAERIPAAAKRALAEAAARRKALRRHAVAKEVGGPKGAEPTRFGDWEVKGIASDF